MDNQNQNKLILFSIYIATPALFVVSAIANFKEYGPIGTAFFMFLGALQMVMLDLRYKIAFWINFLPLFFIGVLTNALVSFSIFGFAPVGGSVSNGSLGAILSFFVILFLPIMFYKQRNLFVNKFNLSSDIAKLLLEDRYFWKKYAIAIVAFSLIAALVSSHMK